MYFSTASIRRIGFLGSRRAPVAPSSLPAVAALVVATAVASALVSLATSTVDSADKVARMARWTALADFAQADECLALGNGATSVLTAYDLASEALDAAYSPRAVPWTIERSLSPIGGTASADRAFASLNGAV
jgi:hypothetical protein